jgi:TMEM175 potassium channel family protein
MTQPTPEQPEGPAVRPRPGERLLVSSGNLEYDRVLFFSDAIFAIAITLLVLEIPRSGTSTAKILDNAWPRILSFGISFLVIGMFWMAHHSTFRYITVLDRRLIALNLMFCGIIAFLPYPTALLSEGQGPGQLATIFYAACMAGAGLLEMIIWVYATHGNRLTTGLTAAERRYVALRVSRVPAVFLLSIPVALASPTAGSLCWLLIWPSARLIERRYGPGLAAASPGS